jgi:hypothetical protein
MALVAICLPAVSFSPDLHRDSDHLYLLGMWFPGFFSSILPILLNSHSLTDKHAGTPMGITAENLAEKYGISREVCHFVALPRISSRLNSFSLTCSRWILMA